MWRSIGIKNSSGKKPQTKISLSKKQILNFHVEKTINQRANSATFRLRMFFIFPVLKENLKIKLQKAQNKYIRFCLNLPLRSRINLSHFRKIK